jgi:vacuolar protein sorting-associated protein 18
LSFSISKEGIKEVMELIRECSLIRIEDVLPFFPDFWVIDDFKDEICKSLEEYSSEIADLNEEMEKATENADLIRQDIHGVRDRFGHVSMNQKCALTGEQLHGRPFYLFPCGHAVLDQTLTDEVLRGGSRALRAKIMKVRSQLANPESIRAEVQVPKESLESPDSFFEEAVRKLRRRLDEYVAAECPLCGDLMIRSIDEPLISLHETAIQESWRV